jgi:hypothetical protein
MRLKRQQPTASYTENQERLRLLLAIPEIPPRSRFFKTWARTKGLNLRLTNK